MKITRLNRQDFLELVYSRKDEFLARIHAPEFFIVKNFYDKNDILALRNRVFGIGLQTDPSWHPLLDECPDYHRVHDNYPQAHVKSRMHGFYFHGWLDHNSDLFNRFSEIFEIKCFLGGLSASDYVNTRPSSGAVARVNFQNYPSGGGYIAEHADPNSNYALIQTLVQASQPGKDFKSGGLFAREAPKSEKIFLEFQSDVGDLLVLSPAVPHGVDPIDPDLEYQWKNNSGKWTILPLIVAADYPDNRAAKPREVNY